MIKELSSIELNQYISSSRFCKIGEAHVLEGEMGRVMYVLPEEGEIDLVVRRNSGDGQILVEAGGSASHVVHSKISQTIKLGTVKEFSISRPKGSLGEVSILGVIFHKKTIQTIPNWKNLISKCKTYKNIKLIGSRLFANAGAFIEASVAEIDTEPPGMYTILNDRIKFLGACEITNLVLNGIPPKPIVKTNDLNIPVLNQLDRAASEIHLAETGHVLYDSMDRNDFNPSKPGQSNKTKFINSNGQNYLLLRRGGEFTVPISSLKNNGYYLIVFNLKRLNGNGKLKVGFSRDEEQTFQGSELIANTEMDDRYLKLQINHSGQLYKLCVGMAEYSIGEVLISRIRVLETDNLFTSVVNINENSEIKILQNSSIVTYSLSPEIDSDDLVYLTTKKFSNTNNNIKSNISYPEVNGTIAVSTVSGLSWYGKIKPLFPNLKIQNDKHFKDKEAFIINGHETFIPGYKMWVDVFDSSKLTSDKIDILKSAQIIYSPSLRNVQFLQSRCPGTIIHLQRPIPYYQPTEVKYFNNFEYILAFHRGEANTKRLLEMYESWMPRLVLVGGRGSYPSFVCPVNEYLSYDKLLFIMKNAKCVVDLSTHRDYESSFLRMANWMGVPVVSNNWCVIEKDNSIFTADRDESGLPTVSCLRNEVRRALQMRGTDKTETINFKVVEVIKSMLNGC